MLRKSNENNEVKIEKLNLIPIMDAVFIFIFFLLFSVQFIKIFEIESDAPMISEVPKDKKEKEPLNLKVTITPGQVILTKGFNDIIIKKFPFIKGSDFNDLKQLVYGIRKRNPNETYIVVAPRSNVKYEDIVKIIDAVKTLPTGVNELPLVVKGENKKLTTIFEQIVLEPIE